MSVKPFPKTTCAEDHAGEVLWSALDWLVRKDERNIQIDPKYSDDMSFIRSQLAKINSIKRVVPDMLKEADLIENSSKREEYEVSRSGNEKWKSCKYLGSLLDTEKDIGRRKCLAFDAVTTLNPLFKSRNLSEVTKIRIFEAFVSSIFLYNSELWTVTPTIEKKIDSFQRRLLRRVLQILWPKIITNKRLYEKTEVVPWSKKIMRRRLTWLGHLLRLNTSKNSIRRVFERIEKTSRTTKTYVVQTSDKKYKTIQ